MKYRPKLISELHGYRGKGTKKEIAPSRDQQGGALKLFCTHLVEKKSGE